MGVSVLVSTFDVYVNIRVKTAFETSSTFCRQNVFNGNSSAESKWYSSLKLAIKLHVFKNLKNKRSYNSLPPMAWFLEGTYIGLLSHCSSLCTAYHITGHKRNSATARLITGTYQEFRHSQHVETRPVYLSSNKALCLISKQPEREANHRLSTLEAKNSWNITSSRPNIFVITWPFSNPIQTWIIFKYSARTAQ
jgi:hypothetical protein